MASGRVPIEKTPGEEKEVGLERNKPSEANYRLDGEYIWDVEVSPSIVFPAGFVMVKRRATRALD